MTDDGVQRQVHAATAAVRTCVCFFFDIVFERAIVLINCFSLRLASFIALRRTLLKQEINLRLVVLSSVVKTVKKAQVSRIVSLFDWNSCTKALDRYLVAQKRKLDPILSQDFLEFDGQSKKMIGILFELKFLKPLQLPW